MTDEEIAAAEHRARQASVDHDVATYPPRDRRYFRVCAVLVQDVPALIAALRERAERIRALEAKCDLLAASLKKADKERDEARAEQHEAEAARDSARSALEFARLDRRGADMELARERADLEKAEAERKELSGYLDELALMFGPGPGQRCNFSEVPGKVRASVEALREAAQDCEQTHKNHCGQWEKYGRHAPECMLDTAEACRAALASPREEGTL